MWPNCVKYIALYSFIVSLIIFSLLLQYVFSFIVPLRKQVAALGVSADAAHVLCANEDVIYKWHLVRALSFWNFSIFKKTVLVAQSILLELKKRIEIDRLFVIGDVLCWIAPSDVYQVYTQHYDNAVSVFEQQRRQPNEAFLAFVQSVRQKEPSFNTVSSFS